MSRSSAAMDASVRAISSVTMAGSVSIGSGAPPTGGGAPGAVVRERRDEVVAVDDGLQRVADQRDRTAP